MRLSAGMDAPPTSWFGLAQAGDPLRPRSGTNKQVAEALLRKLRVETTACAVSHAVVTAPMTTTRPDHDRAGRHLTTETETGPFDSPGRTSPGPAASHR